MRLPPPSTEYQELTVDAFRELPPPLNFEVALARKIKAQRTPILQIFARLDEDGDGYLSTTDLKNGLHHLFDMEVNDKQIAAIFSRAAYFLPKHKTDQDAALMTTPMFLRYVDCTAESTIVPSSTIHTGSSIVLKAAIKTRNYVEHPMHKSEVYRSRHLRALVLQLISQNISTSRSNAVNTQSFLNMDTNRNNEITREEFRSWLKQKGLDLTDEDMKLLFGKWQKGEGLSVKEFGVFVETLASDLVAISKNPNITEGADELDLSVLSINQRDGDEIENHDDSHMSDVELIWAFLNHFRDLKKSYIQGFHYLDKDDNKYLTAREIRAGLEECGLNVSTERCNELMASIVSAGGKMDKPSFVRFITSAPIQDYPLSHACENEVEERDPPEE